MAFSQKNETGKLVPLPGIETDIEYLLLDIQKQAFAQNKLSTHTLISAFFTDTSVIEQLNHYVKSCDIYDNSVHFLGHKLEKLFIKTASARDADGQYYRLKNKNNIRQ